MKSKITLLFILIAAAANAQLTFTDPVLKSYLLSSTAVNNIAFNASNQSMKIDANSNGQIEVAEANAVVRVWIENPDIVNLGGIQGFVNLTNLDVKATAVTAVTLVPMPTLQKLQFLECAQLTSVNIVDMTGLTQVSCTENPLMTAIDLEGCTNLTTLIIRNTGLTTLDASTNVNMLNMYLDQNALTSVNVLNCALLNSVNLANNQLTSLNVSGLTNLTSVFADNNDPLTSFNASGCTALTQYSQTGQFTQPNLATIDLTNCSSLASLFNIMSPIVSLQITGCSSLPMLDFGFNNMLTQLDVTGCTSLQSLNCSNGTLQTLNLGNLTQLTTVSAYNNQISTLINIGPNVTTLALHDNQFTDFTLSNHAALTVLDLLDNPLININVTNCPLLSGFSVQPINTDIEVLNISNCPMIVTLGVDSNNFQTINVQGCTGLTFLAVNGELSSTSNVPTLNLSGLSNLQTLHARNLNLTSIDLTACNALTNAYLDENNLTGIDLSSCPNLTSLDLYRNQLQTIDLSQQTAINQLNLGDNAPLETIFAKNGVAETFNLTPFNSSLTFICQDAEAVVQTQDEVDDLPFVEVVCNSYCSFTPGGDYNLIGGTIRFDADNDGCDTDDAIRPNVRIDITNGTDTGATFTNASGQYSFYTGIGDFNLSPSIENASAFTISPATASVPFGNDDNNSTVQNFCITANGVVNDVEIVIAPIVPARPGFDAWYSITIKNKGNQTLSGSYYFEYNEDLMDFVIATQPTFEQTNGLLVWNYDSLLPFESRSVYVSLNINSPVETPAVNLGDVLTFNSNITPNETDVTPQDNEFVFQQTVVGSYDPNDIICIEGDIAPPSEIGEYLHYVVNFENTGTAAAENIVVRLAIDPEKYNIDTLQLLNTSHACRATITDNVIEFIFQGINLGTDSTPPVGGHGNVLFKIRSNNNLNQGDSVTSAAKIYFDYNAPIDTNDAETVFQLLSNPEHGFDQSVTFYPNPAQTTLHIDSSFNIETVALYDVQGRILENNFVRANGMALDISGKPKGIYFVKVTTAKGIKVEKIIKE
jgi:Leucine-rich repeat (LRR) protein